MSRRRRRPKRQGPTEREGGRAVVLVLLVVVLLAGMGWVAAYAEADGKLPTGTRVAGVAVGGRDPQAAARELSLGLAARMRTDLTLQVDDRTHRVTPAAAGLSVDYLGSVERAAGTQSWGPGDLWNYYTGGRDYAPVVTVDDTAMGALLDRLDRTLGTSPRDGQITFADGTVQVTQPRAGASIDHPEAAEEIRQAWAAGRTQVRLPVRVTQPTVSQAQLQTAVTQLANPALAGPVTLRFDHSQVTLEPAQYASMLTIAPQDGQLAIAVDSDALAALVRPSTHDTQPRDATVRLADSADSADSADGSDGSDASSGSGVTVVRAHAGHSFDAQDVATAFLSAVDATGDQRTVKVVGQVTAAGFTTHDAKALGVTTQVSTYRVHVPRRSGDALAQAAAKLSGTVVRPGATLSYDRAVGAVTGLTSGSASRLATATWNAGLLAGLTDVERTAPTTPSSAAQAGRDVSVGSGTDLQMRDDTAYGVLLEAHVSGRYVTVRMWSTPQYTGSVSVGAPYDVVPRATRVDATTGCRPETGSDGFSIDLTRTLTSTDGATQPQPDVVTTTYQPSSAVVCAGAPG